MGKECLEHLKVSKEKRSFSGYYRKTIKLLTRINASLIEKQ